MRDMYIPVTVLYVDLSGYTRMVQTRSPEEVAEAMDRFFQIVEEEVSRTGGFLYQRLGDGALCIFGYPESLEDEGDRALTACCALLQRIRDLPGDLGIHGGVASGKVLTVPGREVRFVGPPMNLAARLQDLAPCGTFLVDEATVHLTRHAFRFTPAGETEVPGFGVQKIYRLEGVLEKGRTWREGFLQDVFVGRERELADLYAAWEHFLSEPRPSVVRIIGEAGIGKTRLVVEFLETLPSGTPTLIARALPYGMPPFGPLIYALRRLASSPGSENPLLEAAPSALSRVQDALTSGVLQASEESVGVFVQNIRDLIHGPTLFILEDAQWADSFTHRVVTTLLREGLPIFLILIARKPLRDDAIWRSTLQDMEREFPALVFRLGPLGPADIQRWWEAVFGEPLPAERTRQLLQVTGGLPLLLEEYARHIQEAPSGENLPRHIEELLLARTAHLPLKSQELLEMASLLGQIFFREPLQQALGWDEATWAHALEPLLARGLVIRRTVRQRTDWEELAFRHILLQEAVFHRLPRKRKRVYARKLLEIFRHEDIPTLQHSQLLARFAFFAGDQDMFEEALLKTTESLIATGAWQEVLRFLREFPDMETLLTSEVFARVETRRAQALIETGAYDKARSVLEQNRERWGDRPADRILLGTLLERESRYKEAMEVLRTTRPSTPEEARQRLEEMIWVAYLMGQEEEVDRLWQAYDRLPPPERPLDRARVLNLRANTLPEKRGKTVIALRKEVLALALTHGFRAMEATVRNNLSMLASRGRIGEALMHLERALELFRNLGEPLGEAIVLYNLGEVHASIGAFDQAKEYLDAYLEKSARIRNRLAFVYGNLTLGRIAHVEGNPERALHHFREASRWAHHLHSEGLRSLVQFHQAWLLLELGRDAGGEIARWAWKRWDAFDRAYFLWRWGDHPAVKRWAPPERVTPSTLLRACTPPMGWEIWLDWMVDVMEREPSWRDRLMWKARAIFSFVWEHTPEALRPHLAAHPRYGFLRS